ncbi:isoflavonoid glucosyltransferase [Trifolium pratense]|uniref:Glycosyltransferase n=1 Tax=Trifolium pratense TaxID=57577 RepID=A0A2K3N4Q4_TRIPR|nr:isoflavonoid glucosyltransferase [Trifolium pratense]PNX98033.1 isoflavonoid glucosyltransferase [Trifolium pratense]
MEGVEVERPLKLHFIPYLAPGHMIPLGDIATLFALRGQQVTIITTPSNAHFFTKSLSFANPFFLRLQTVEFPSQQVGLPEGVESMSSTTNSATTGKILAGAMLLHGPIQDFMEKDPPDCIVGDSVYPWVHDLARKLQIPFLSFSGFSLFTVSLMETLRTNNSINSDTDFHLDSGSYVVPNFPHCITMCSKPPKMFTGYMEMVLEWMIKSNGLIINNFAELDGEECIEHYEKTTSLKSWHLGPVSLIRRTNEEKAERGNENVVSVHECLSWLNSKHDNSVLYISYGSICYFSDKQLYEIACGIEASGHKFIWVVPEKIGKEDESDEEKEKWLPKGFEERNIGNNGLIIRGWAPQIMILSHTAVGAFMTHCGWNSIVEAVSSGVPMITWPVHGEQFYNEKLITDVRRIGVEVGATEWCLNGVEEKEKVVSRDSIERAVKRLMDDGDEAEEIRGRAREFRDKARLAVQEGGSSQKNLLALIDELKRLRDHKPLD